MDDSLTIREMLAYQKRLQDKYSKQWGEPIAPETSVNKLLWAHGELAEASDIVKKNRPARVAEDSELQRHLMEELGDVMMYLMDVLLCYDLSPEEFSKIYREKCERNVNRW